ncbi:MAG TPA: nucleotidyltransferase domain-containing protein [Allosphingosinicella sp.]|nr:nucleotidyltransferase domain-containing protein [Allosphingosinicella sp.]
MKRDDVLEKIRLAAPELKRLGFGKLYLFGSVARGEAETRDVDLLYETAADPMDYFIIVEAIEKLEAILGQPVDLVERHRLHERIRSRVEAELVEIY